MVWQKNKGKKKSNLVRRQVVGSPTDPQERVESTAK